MKTRTIYKNALLLLALFGAVTQADAQTPGDPQASVSQLLQQLRTDPRGLNEDRVAETVLRASPDLKARREQVMSAAAAVDQALIAFIPKLTTSGTAGIASRVQTGELGSLVAAPGAPPGPLPPGSQLVNTPISFPLSPAHRYALQASLNVPLSDYLLRTRQALSGAQKNEESVEVNRQASVLSTAVEARVLFYNWVRALLQSLVAEQTLRQSEDHLHDVRNSFDAGQASRADVLSSESQRARSELLLERAKDLVQLAEQQLRIAMHDASGAPYRVGQNVLTPDSTLPKSMDLPAIQNEGVQQRLEPRVLDRAADSLKEQAKVANAGLFPRLDGIASVLYGNPNTNVVPLRDGFTTTWFAGLQASWEITGIADSAAARRGFEARAAETEARRRAAEDAIRTEIAQSWQALQDARASAQWSARSLASAEEAYRVRRELFQNGRASNVELTDAETDLTSSRFSVVDAQIDLRIAAIRLTHAIGHDIAGR